MDRSIELAALWDRIWARRGWILTLATAAALVVGVIAFLLPPWYKAEAELLPPSDDDTGMSLSSMLRGVAVPGVRIPSQISPGEVFQITLESRRVSEEMVNRFDLKHLYHKKFMIDAIKELRHHARFKQTLAGSIQISVEDRSPQRAAAMANAYIEFLDKFNREVRMTKGRRTRMFVETRLEETKHELEAAEQRLALYQAQHKTVALTPGMSSAVEDAARLYARRMALEVRLGVVRGYSEGSEEELQIRQELEQLDRQMSALPETGLELGRLMRDVKALEQVFALLTAQYEEARINEARDVVTVDLLDDATVPEKKSRPHRITMIGVAFLLAMGLGVGLALSSDRKEERLPVMRAVAGE
jgi:uncharacterized protein involved in exopolysaccharide biosynthesis